MWPTDETKYGLVRKTIKNPTSRWKPLTYWRTDLKNLHFTYQLLKYAQDNEFKVGQKWFERCKRLFYEYKQLDDTGSLTENGKSLLLAFEKYLENDPRVFQEDVNPFQLEYIFHKTLYFSGYRDLFSNVQEVFKTLPDINIYDSKTIVTLVRINNGPETLEAFGSLSKEEKEELFENLLDLEREMSESGGLHRVKTRARDAWAPYLKILSAGALGGQNDGYYRAMQLIKAQILLLTHLELIEKTSSSVIQLYSRFEKNITEEDFRELLRYEPSILIGEDGETCVHSSKQIGDSAVFAQIDINTQTSEEVQKIEYETVRLSEEEKINAVLQRLKKAEETPIIYVPKEDGVLRTTRVRHKRDPRTAAALRFVFRDVCQLCGFDGKKEFGIGIAEVDHAIDEISAIQNNRPSNLVVLCPNCHAAKTKKSILFTSDLDFFNVDFVLTGVVKRIKKLDLAALSNKN